MVTLLLLIAVVCFLLAACGATWPPRVNLVALGLLDRVGESVVPTELAQSHLAAGSPYDLRAYYASPADKSVAINELVDFDYAGRGYHLKSE